MATKIIAENKKEFEELEAALESFPLSWKKGNVIESIEKNFSVVKVTFHKRFENELKIYVPKNVAAIEVNVTSVSFYTIGFMFQIAKTESQFVKIDVMQEFETVKK